MRKSRLFPAMLAPALLATDALAGAAPARADDAAYCAVLSDQALHYLASCAIDGDNKPDTETRAAIDACDQGRTAAGIAVLERKLRNNGFTLPTR
jgi:hypothetical protein